MRKRIIRRMRKNIMRVGKITRVEVLNREDDGTKLPKKEWGYAVNCEVNGRKICCADDSWYEAWQGAWFCAQWASEQPLFVPPEKDEE